MGNSATTYKGYDTYEGCFGESEICSIQRFNDSDDEQEPSSSTTVRTSMKIPSEGNSRVHNNLLGNKIDKNPFQKVEYYDSNEKLNFLGNKINKNPFQKVEYYDSNDKLKSTECVSNTHDFTKDTSLASRVLTTKPGKKGIEQKQVLASYEEECGPLHIGCLLSRNSLCCLWTTSIVKVEINYGEKLFNNYVLYDDIKRYKLQWRFKDIGSIDAMKIKGGADRSLLLTMWIAPYVYEQPCSKNINDDSSWIRTTDFSPKKSIGESFNYCIQLPLAERDSFNALFKNLKSFNVASNYSPGNSVLQVKNGFSYSTNQTVVPILCSPGIESLPFDLIFQVNSLTQEGYLSGPSLRKDFFNLLHPSNTEVNYSKHVLDRIRMRDEPCFDPQSWFRNQLRELQGKGKQPNLSEKPVASDGLIQVRRLLVTPSKAYFVGPELDTSNRVTRKFARHLENFMRVSFVDEDKGCISSSMLMVPGKGKTERTEVYTRILSVLKNGFSLGGKRFEFLAFSSSQLRENSAWMFASSGATTAESIRLWMGDFLGIRNVAKCAARMGQCFSSSTESLNVELDEVEMIPDIERVAGGVKYCFSDGIGKISKTFAAQVANNCDYKRFRSGNVPSAFQIRYGGFKGVIAVDPHSYFKLSLRRSMKKFPSRHTSLEILNCSGRIPCYLNRQIITLLSTLGIPDYVFEEMLRKVMQQLKQILQSCKIALGVLQIFGAGSSHKLALAMLSAGYNPDSEPFLRRILLNTREFHLMKLRTKARIFVPKGRLLMGCLDETATLNYGQAFVKVSPTRGPRNEEFSEGLTSFDKPCIVTGKIAITKSPCVHPGDVRVLNAIDIPALHHMVDCIVFPQKGPRPHPDECSGSDLDGDLYFVTWDKNLIPSEVDPPMDYRPPPEEELDHAVTVEEILEYFVNYMVNDSLGIISNAHTALADSDVTLKARHPKCLELAKLCSIAVDFPKTGVPAILRPDLRPSQYPDFMEKTGVETYKSQSILGKLYRLAKQDDRGEDGIERNLSLSFTKEDARRRYDSDMEVPGFEDYLDQAETWKQMYDWKLSGLMNRYGIKTEVEILSGQVLDVSKAQQRKRDKGEKGGGAMEKAVGYLLKEALGWFEQGGGDYRAKASSWYHVTYHPHYVGNGKPEFGHVHFLSFPWLVFDKLLAIKKGKNQASR